MKAAASYAQLRRDTQRHATFHEGELFVQEATGERALAERHGRLISNVVPPPVAAFLAEQNMLVFATQDASGDLWASVVHGRPGFVGIADGGAVVIARGSWEVAHGDALLGNLELGSRVGLLAIELGSRRRYRINGRVVLLGADRIEIGVVEAYVNCPKYIQRRTLLGRDPGSGAHEPAAHGLTLDALRQARIQSADTMFVATHHPARGLDASHRGGEPGFIEVTSEATLRVPEYPGNSLYNTLGNLVVSKRAGLAVVDFEDGRVLQLRGHAEVVLDAADRYWDFTISSWTELPLSGARSWQLVERSRFNPPTGA